MKLFLKIYSASCLIVLGFFAFFLVPWEILPFSDGVNGMVVGGTLLAVSAFYILYFHRREGLELGWLLANRGGFWAIIVAVLGFVLLLCGTLLSVSPELFVPAFEQGALPFGIVIVSLFWLALIFMFGFLAFMLTSGATASLRVFQFGEAVKNGAMMLVCLGLAGVFFSLFLEVINDIAFRISIPNQWTAIWIFVGSLLLAGVIFGVSKDPSYFVESKLAEGSNKE